MTIAIIDARGPKYVVVSAGAAVAGALAEQARASAISAALSEAHAESLNGPTYASTAAGLAATASGGFFAVDNGDGTVSIYLDNAGVAVLQRRLATTAALASDTGDALVSTKGAGASAVARTQQAVNRDRVSILGYSTVQAAIDTNERELHAPKGDYVSGTLNFDNDYQRIVGPGARFIRNANGTSFNISARSVQHYGTRFGGGGFSGNNITITKPEAVLFGCDSKETSGRALKATNDAGGALIVGGIYNTTDATASGYDIELFDTTPGTSLYQVLFAVSSQQATGGILIDGPGTVRVIASQTGKFTVLRGGGMFVGNRFAGAVSVQSTSNQFSCCAFADDVTFGDGAGGNFSNCSFGPDNQIEAGNTFTINSDVIESHFYLKHLANVTLVISGLNNDIHHNEIAYTPTLVGSGTAVGNATVSGQVTRAGKEWRASGEIIIGSTTNLGGGGGFGITAPFKAKSNALGHALLVDSGTGNYIGLASMAAGSNRIDILAGTQPIGGIMTTTAPFTWVAGDIIRWSIQAEYTT